MPKDNKKKKIIIFLVLFLITILLIAWIFVPGPLLGLWSFITGGGNGWGGGNGDNGNGNGNGNDNGWWIYLNMSPTTSTRGGQTILTTITTNTHTYNENGDTSRVMLSYRYKCAGEVFISAEYYTGTSNIDTGGDWQWTFTNDLWAGEWEFRATAFYGSQGWWDDGTLCSSDSDIIVNGISIRSPQNGDNLYAGNIVYVDLTGTYKPTWAVLFWTKAEGDVWWSYFAVMVTDNCGRIEGNIYTHYPTPAIVPWDADGEYEIVATLDMNNPNRHLESLDDLEEDMIPFPDYHQRYGYTPDWLVISNIVNVNVIGY